MNKTILIVDDSEVMRRQVALALTGAGFAIVEACDGLDGLEQLARRPDVALVICDVKMPRMNGLEMIAEGKANPAHAGLPILMLTTEGSAEDIATAKKAGARGWIVKPFVAAQLIAAAQKLTSMAAKPAQPAVAS